MKLWDRVLVDIDEDSCCGQPAMRVRYPAIIVAVAKCPYDESVPMYLCAVDHVGFSAIWMLEPDGSEDDRMRPDPNPQRMILKIEGAP